MFAAERLLDIYHAVESLCFYTAKEIATQMQVVDGALTLRVPHGPTCMRVVVADLLRVLPAHILATRATSEENARAWFPQPDTHWGLESAAQLPEYRRRALGLLETLCEVAASGKHRRLYQKIDADAVNATQDLALVSAGARVEKENQAQDRRRRGLARGGGGRRALPRARQDRRADP